MIAQRDGVRNPALLLILSSVFLLSANCAFAQAGARATEQVDNSNRITLTGNVHPLARSEFDRGRHFRLVDNSASGRIPMTQPGAIDQLTA
jgi:hypothetical protein